MKIQSMLVAALGISFSSACFANQDVVYKDLFKNTEVKVMSGYGLYSKWKKDEGRYFSLEANPVVHGLVKKVNNPAPQKLDVSSVDEEDVGLKNFMSLINHRNKNGQRTSGKKIKKGMDVNKLYQKELSNAFVFELGVSGVVDVPLDEIEINSDELVELISEVDTDHNHYSVEGDVAAEVFEKSNINYKKVDRKKDYLLSVIDTSRYGCSQFSLGLFALEKLKGVKLWKKSIYMLSDVELNNKSDIDNVGKLLGKKPDVLVSQNILFSDLVLKSGRALFALYKEGDKTRVVLVSYFAMDGEYFGKGTKGDMAKTIMMKGMFMCKSGLSAGIPYYTKKLFNNFVDYIY